MKRRKSRRRARRAQLGSASARDGALLRESAGRSPSEVLLGVALGSWTRRGRRSGSISSSYALSGSYLPERSAGGYSLPDDGAPLPLGPYSPPPSPGGGATQPPATQPPPIYRPPPPPPAPTPPRNPIGNPVLP